MFMKNRITRIMAISAVSLLTVSGAHAADGAGTASVTVQGSFNVDETTPLSFGTVVAIANSNTTPDLATLKVDSDGVTADIATNGNAAILTPIVAGTPATFTVSGAAPNTVLTLTTPGDFQLTDPSGTDTKAFDISGFEFTSITSGTAFTFDTDGTGTLVFNLGATLSTETPAGGGAADVAIPYDDVTFTGTYTMTVNY